MMRYFNTLLGILAVLCFCALISPTPRAAAGILIESSDIQPTGDPHYFVYYNLAVPAGQKLLQNDVITIFDIPILGSTIASFTAAFQSFISPIFEPYGGFFTASVSHLGIATPVPPATDTPTWNITFKYTGGLNPTLTDNTAGSTPLALGHNIFGFITNNLPGDAMTQNTLTTPQNFTSQPTNGSGTITGPPSFSGSVTPVIDPEPATIVMLLTVAPIGFVAWRRHCAKAKAA